MFIYASYYAMNHDQHKGIAIALIQIKIIHAFLLLNTHLEFAFSFL